MRDIELDQALARYRTAFAATWAADTLLRPVRFVVLDCETTGFDARRDRIVSIGAVAVIDDHIDLADGLELLLRVQHNTAATLVHGITRAETRAGLNEPTALARLLDYLRDGVIVGHHINHDLAMLNAALARHGGGALANRRLDTGLLAARLIDDGAFADRDPPTALTLDALCAVFGIIPHDRHTAAGDAFLTAQVLLRLRRLAERHGHNSLASLLEHPDGLEPPAGMAPPP